MTRFLSLTAGVAILLGTASSQAVQLRDGSILVGEIQDASGEGFTLLRTDNGGVLKLRWNHLTESSAKVHRAAWDLLNTEDEEVAAWCTGAGLADVSVRHFTPAASPASAAGLR